MRLDNRRRSNGRQPLRASRGHQVAGSEPVLSELRLHVCRQPLLVLGWIPGHQHHDLCSFVAAVARSEFFRRGAGAEPDQSVENRHVRESRAGVPEAKQRLAHLRDRGFELVFAREPRTPRDIDGLVGLQSSGDLSQRGRALFLCDERVGREETENDEGVRDWMIQHGVHTVVQVSARTRGGRRGSCA